MKKKTPNLIYVLAAASAMFIGILIICYFIAKQANPVMLDEHGRPQRTASLALPFA